MLIRGLPLVAAALPVIGVAAAYCLNVRAGILPSCLPLLDGCISISATGRYMPGSMPFRAALLPQAVVLVMLWGLSAAWLGRVSPSCRHRTAIVFCGVTAAAALVLYVTFLGSKQPFYEFMRHFGVYFYFLGTAIAQAMLTIALRPSGLRRIMLLFALLPFGLGVLNLIVSEFISDPGTFQNRIEWTVALLMQIWFVFLYQAWRRSGLDVRITANQN